MKLSIGTFEHDENSIATQIRLVRNLADFPFSHICTDKQKHEIARRIRATFSASDPTLTPISFDGERELFLSPERDGTLLLGDGENKLIITANGENHLTILSRSSGLSPDRAYERARLYDQAFCDSVAVAFDRKFGYLTARPDEAGCGLTVSCLLHLPALSICGQIASVKAKMKKCALSLDDLLEQAENADCLYRLSTKEAQLSEKELLAKLTVAALSIVGREKELCKSLYVGGGVDFKDNLCRAYGVLLYAEKLTHTEFRKLWSEVLTGVECGIFPDISADTLTALWLYALPCHLSTSADAESKTISADVRRAAMARKALRKERFQQGKTGTKANTHVQTDTKSDSAADATVPPSRNSPNNGDKGENI